MHNHPRGRIVQWAEWSTKQDASTDKITESAGTFTPQDHPVDETMQSAGTFTPQDHPVDETIQLTKSSSWQELLSCRSDACKAWHGVAD